MGAAIGRPVYSAPFGWPPCACRLDAALREPFVDPRPYEENAMLDKTKPSAPPAPDYAAIKQRQQAMWACGDYAVIGTTLQIVGESLCEAIDLRSGERVLDVAAGNGNATLAAARRFTQVTSTDYVGALLDVGRARAAAEHLPVTFREADAEALPFADDSFDVVLSTFGVMFAPHQEASASELSRVVRKGGRIGLANWTPEGFIGQLFKTMGKHVPPPAGDPDAPLQLFVANLDASDYVGRIAIGRVFNGHVAIGDTVAVAKLGGTLETTRVTKLYAFDGLKRVDVDRASAGDIVCLAGIADITIGETITDAAHPMPLPPLAIDEPTVSMIFGVNTSPMAGREGQFVTSRQLRDRLARELLGNVSIRVEDTDTPEHVKVIGRGELQLSILIEMMRREGYELQVSRPEIVTRIEAGQVYEPVEALVIDVAED
jgi:SAM-dependent methyltransferase